MHAFMKAVVPLAAALAACTPPKKPATGNGDIPVEFEVQQPESRDAYYEFGALALQGYYFAPHALDEPELPTTMAKRTIEEQKKRYAKAKGAARAAEGQNLVLVLWFTPAPDGTTDKEARKLVKAQRKDALAVARELAADPKATEASLQLAGAVEQAVGDAEKAAAIWDRLVQQFPKSKKLGAWQGLRDYLDLRAGRPFTFALPADLGNDTAPELAYVTAWSRLRAGDPKGAAQALGVAAQGWTNLWSLTWIRFDVLIMYTRAGVDVPTSTALLTDLCKRDNADLRKMLTSLADAYYGAGEYDSSLAVWRSLAEAAPPAELANLSILQAFVNFQMMRPDQAAEAALAAWDAAIKAGAGLDPALKETIATRIREFAVRYDRQFDATRDARLVPAAKKLYETYLKIPDRTDTEEARTSAAKLAANADQPPDAAKSALDKDSVDVMVKVRREQVVGCYERTLQRTPDLSGTVKVTFDVTESGAVSEVVTEPAGGEEGLGQVAGCLAERIKAWKFPARLAKGITRVAYPFTLARAQ